jgi:diguanylate cyclase (GGDEF)-like protein
MDKNLASPAKHTRLTVKLAAMVTLVGSLMLIAIGFHFDSFLRASFLESTQTRMQHAFQRLAFNIRSIEEQLKEGVAFIQDDEEMIASINLINTYEDKDNYNPFLIDEEKKLLAGELLEQVELSFNDEITLFNASGGMIATICKVESRFATKLISYDAGKPVVLKSTTGDSDYTRTTAQESDTSLHHTALYSDAALQQGSIITRHYEKGSLVLRSHLSLFEGSAPQAHVELSRVLDDAFFRQLADNLDIELELSLRPITEHPAPDLSDPDSIRELSIDESGMYYSAEMRIDSLDGPIYITARLDRALLQRVLQDNRMQFLILLVLIAIGTTLLVRVMINRSIEQPLNTLMAQIDKIERADYSTTPPVRTGDEIETISVNVNRLAEAVREREASLERSRAELEHLSNHDALTNLPNRRYFGQHLEHVLTLARREQEKFALFFIDLDQFKQINDTLGHNLGDELLKRVAARLGNNVRASDTLARIGGDEFNILIERVHHLEELEPIVSKYLSLFDAPFMVAGHELSISASIGVALYPMDGHDSVTLIKNADMAMYKAKESGRNKYCFFSDDLSEQMKYRTAMTRALQSALRDTDQFSLVFQPKISTSTGLPVSAEALIRWNSPAFGNVPPNEFIPLAEELGLIVPIGEWVLEQACRAFSQMQQQGVQLNHISVNISNVQLSSHQLLPTLRRVMRQNGLSGDQLELEITESYIATDFKNALVVLRNLREMGLHLAIDDFGTGYSSMSYLQQLPVTRLKIDKSFVDGLPHSRDSIAISRAIINLAQNFQLQLTAEGVENEAQADFIKQEGCDEIQGYFYSKPLPLEQFISFYRTMHSANNVVPLRSES